MMLDSPHTLAPMLMRGNALVLKNTPPSHAGKQIQLYLKSLELKNGPAQGADFSLSHRRESTIPARYHLA
jgi:hypothetical protein